MSKRREERALGLDLFDGGEPLFTGEHQATIDEPVFDSVEVRQTAELLNIIPNDANEIGFIEEDLSVAGLFRYKGESTADADSNEKNLVIANTYVQDYFNTPGMKNYFDTIKPTEKDASKRLIDAIDATKKRLERDGAPSNFEYILFKTYLDEGGNTKWLTITNSPETQATSARGDAWRTVAQDGKSHIRVTGGTLFENDAPTTLWFGPAPQTKQEKKRALRVDAKIARKNQRIQEKLVEETGQLRISKAHRLAAARATGDELVATETMALMPQPTAEAGLDEAAIRASEEKLTKLSSEYARLLAVDTFNTPSGIESTTHLSEATIAALDAFDKQVTQHAILLATNPTTGSIDRKIVDHEIEVSDRMATDNMLDELHILQGTHYRKKNGEVVEKKQRAERLRKHLGVLATNIIGAQSAVSNQFLHVTSIASEKVINSAAFTANKANENRGRTAGLLTVLGLTGLVLLKVTQAKHGIDGAGSGYPDATVPFRSPAPALDYRDMLRDEGKSVDPSYMPDSKPTPALPEQNQSNGRQQPNEVPSPAELPKTDDTEILQSGGSPWSVAQDSLNPNATPADVARVDYEMLRLSGIPVSEADSLPAGTRFQMPTALIEEINKELDEKAKKKQ